jgi:hypothetical protein
MEGQKHAYLVFRKKWKGIYTCIWSSVKNGRAYPHVLGGQPKQEGHNKNWKEYAKK